MEVSRHNCRLCLSMTDFKISLFGSFSRNSNLREKILVCMKIVVDEGDNLTSICYKCAESVEKFYDFYMNIKNCQEKIQHSSAFDRNVRSEAGNRRHVTSYVREQVIEADYTFSFLDISKNEDAKEARPSSPVFSYFSPQNDLYSTGKKWKTPMCVSNRKEQSRRHKMDKPKQLSRDIFESQSQDVEEPEARSLGLDWNLTPDDFILKKVREKCFGRPQF